MTKTYYQLDLNQGGFERGEYTTILIAECRLKYFQANGFPNAFLVKVTEERIKLNNPVVVSALKTVEKFTPKMKIA
jgi:hypothetical protein